MVHKIWQSYPEIEAGLIEVKRILKRELRVKVPEIEDAICQYIDAPGKYLRAGLCLMFAKLCHNTLSENKLYIAAAIEALHLATLIHDDVIDDATSRRGVPSLHTHQSNRIAIYAGDYLMTYAARLASKAYEPIESPPLDSWIMEGILVGELNQLTNQFKIGMSLYDYLRQIRGKTGLLFGAATFAGYYDTRHSAWKNKQAFYSGQALGMAFQLTDDLLDYRASQKDTGKPRYQDVQNGIYTAPLIMAMNASDSSVKSLLKQRGELWTQDELRMLHEQLCQYDVYSRTYDLAQQYVNKSVQRLQSLSQDTCQIQAIEQLMRQLLSRTF